MRKLYLSVILIVLFPLFSEADTIFLKNGTRLDVKKVWNEDGKIKYIMFGTVYSFDSSEVKEVVKGDDKEEKRRYKSLKIT